MMADLTAERAALAADLTAALGPDWVVRDHLPAQPRPTMATIEPADLWVSTPDDATFDWGDHLGHWTIRLIVAPGPPSEVLARLCDAVSLVLDGLPAWTVADITQPMTLVVNDAAAWPSVSLTASRLIERN